MTLIIHSAFLVASGDSSNPGADALGVIRSGAVAIDGSVIVAVGTREALVTDYPEARERRHPGVITPGLVNAHTHLQYTSYADLADLGEPFPVWIGEMMKRRATTTDTQWAESARLGAHAALKAGTTAAADIVTDAAALMPLARSGLRGISYVEALAVDDAGWDGEHRDWVEQTVANAPSGRAAGVSPHTLYTLSRRAFTEACNVARDRGLRIHTHLAESSDEVEYVLGGGGRFAELAQSAGWDMDLVRHGGAGHTPAAEMDALGGLGPDVHVAHGVHCTAEDRALLRERGTAVALCVRSNAILGAGEPPIAAYLAEGSVIGLGTDSLASSPSLDLWDEARAARDLARAQGYDNADLSYRLFQAVTLGGAACLGLAAAANDSAGPDAIGVLRPGVKGDLAAFALPDSAELAANESAFAVFDALVESGGGTCVATVLGGVLVHRR